VVNRKCGVPLKTMVTSSMMIIGGFRGGDRH
jgi:hypothetical protein